MIRKTKLFDGGRINYSVNYKQVAVYTDDGTKLMEKETVKYYKFPFTFGTQVTEDECTDTGAYYRQ